MQAGSSSEYEICALFKQDRRFRLCIHVGAFRKKGVSTCTHTYEKLFHIKILTIIHTIIKIGYGI